MNKIFNSDSIIAVEDYFVVVDKDAGILSSYTTDGVKVYEPSKARDILIKKEVGHLKTKVNKIIATIGKRLEGVPLIELLDNDSELYIHAKEYSEMAVQHINDEQTKLQRQAAYLDFIAGYKAAQSKGTYSEEDLKKAFDAGKRGWYQKRITGNDGSYNVGLYHGIVEDYVKSIQPKKKRRIPASITLLTFVEPDRDEYGVVKRSSPNNIICKSELYITNPKTNSIIPIEVKY